MKLFFVILLLILPNYLRANSLSSFAGEGLKHIKSISPERVEGLLSGKGLGYAKVAELNGYPGPAHVLASAVELRLSAEQKLKTQTNYNEMKARAISLGEQLVKAEADLNQLFNAGGVSEQVVLETLENIGLIESRLRAVHINAHIKQQAILNKDQLAQYSLLRGYKSNEHKHHH